MSNAIITLLGRLLLAAVFIPAGIQKLGGIEGLTGYIASAGLPAPMLLAWASAIFEIVAGIAILVGFQTKLASLALAAFCVFTGIVFHFFAATGDAAQIQMIMFFKNLGLAGGFLVLAAQGPGALSVDAKRAGA